MEGVRQRRRCIRSTCLLLAICGLYAAASGAEASPAVHRSTRIDDAIGAATHRPTASSPSIDNLSALAQEAVNPFEDHDDYGVPGPVGSSLPSTESHFRLSADHRSLISSRFVESATARGPPST